jgi:hypothetical protein
MIWSLIPRKYHWLKSIDIDAPEASPAIKAIAHDLIGFLVRQDQAVKAWRKVVRACKIEVDEQ